MSKRKTTLVKLYCVCQQPYDKNKEMIECSFCQDWYHPVCVGMSNSEFERLSTDDTEWNCKDCSTALALNESSVDADLGAAGILDDDAHDDDEETSWSREIHLETLAESQFSEVFVSHRIMNEGYTLRANGHVQLIQSKTNGKEIIYRGIVQATMRNKQYQVDITVNQDPFSIVSKSCACPAGINGECKHVVAVLYEIFHCVKMGCAEFPDQPACTDLLQKWNAKKSNDDHAILFSDLKVQKISLHKNKTEVGSNISSYSSHINVSKCVTSDSIEQLAKSLESCNFPVLNVWKDRDYTPVIIKEVESKTLIENLFHLVNSATFDFNYEREFATQIRDHLQFFENKIITTIEESLNTAIQTRNQNLSSSWKTKRFFLLTSSTFKKFCHMRETTDASKTHHYLNAASFTSAATSHGKNFESSAIKLFLELPEISSILDEHCTVGLVVNPKIPFLGSSPDYLISIKNGNETHLCLLEVKCPFQLYMTKTKIAAAAENQKDFYLTKSRNSDIEINKNHSVFYQVQGQMNLCNIQKCYLILFVPPKDLVYVQVEKDAAFFNDEVLSKLSKIWFQKLLPNFDPLSEAL